MEKDSAALPLLGFPGKLPVASNLPEMRNGEVQRLLGFWIMWHRYGGVHPLAESGMIAYSTIYRQINEFRAMFGLDVWAVHIDLPVYPEGPTLFHGVES